MSPFLTAWARQGSTSGRKSTESGHFHRGGYLPHLSLLRTTWLCFPPPSSSSSSFLSLLLAFWICRQESIVECGRRGKERERENGSCWVPMRKCRRQTKHHDLLIQMVKVTEGLKPKARHNNSRSSRPRLTRHLVTIDLQRIKMTHKNSCC